MIEMKKRNPQRTFYFYLILSCVTILSVSSCVYTNNSQEQTILSNFSDENKSNFTNVEAELLGKFKKLNSNLITISDIVMDMKIDYNSKSLAITIKNQQMQINKEITDLVSSKLIVIPDIDFEKNFIRELNLSSLDSEKKYLEISQNIIRSEIRNLKELSRNTSDADFKILALQNIVKLSNTIKLIKDESDKSFTQSSNKIVSK